MIGIFIVIFGLTIGSFCIFRIPREESISFPPSHCTNCGTRIKPYDLFPVVSYVLLKGKCRKCGEKISIRYPLIELSTGIIFFFIYLKVGFTIELIKFALLSCFLIVIGMIDYDTTDVYSLTTWSGIATGAIFLTIAFVSGNTYLTYIFGALLGGGVIALIILTTHGMGWGDFEISLLSGLFLGFKLSIIMLFSSFVLGGIIGVILVLTKKKSRKDYIPFGPAIVMGTFLAIFFGQQIINWYFNFI
jgi:leader peptidase (prepilin peptidase)/N-methyltransferase